VIRDATTADVPGILAIYNDAILHTTAVYDYEPHALEARQAWFAQKVEAGFPVLVYESEGRVAGFASFGPFRAWAAYRYTVEHSVYVHPAFRGRGIGFSLLRRIVDVAAEREYKVIVGGIDSANEQSIRLHEKLGFERVGTIEKAGYKFGRWLDLAFYRLELHGPRRP